jgi:hypothetical protein
MFGIGPATRIYLAAGATDMRKYAPSIVMWSRLIGAAESAGFGGSGGRITRSIVWTAASVVLVNPVQAMLPAESLGALQEFGSE